MRVREWNLYDKLKRRRGIRLFQENNIKNLTNRAKIYLSIYLSTIKYLKI